VTCAENPVEALSTLHSPSNANRQQWCLNQAEAGDTGGIVGLHAVDVQRTGQLKPRVAVAVRTCLRIVHHKENSEFISRREPRRSHQ
jgi:hypothetical protein